MSAIQNDNGYLVITANGRDPHAGGISAISDSDYGFDISFDKEEAADALMGQLAEALCGKWLDDDSAELLS